MSKKTFGSKSLKSSTTLSLTSDDDTLISPRRKNIRYKSRSHSRSHTKSPRYKRFRSSPFSRSRSFSHRRRKYESHSSSISSEYRHRQSYRKRRHSYMSRSRSSTRSVTPWRTKIDWLIDHNHIKRSDIEENTITQLEDMSDALSDVVIARFSEVNFSRILNKNGFLLGIIRRIQQDGLDKGVGDFKILPDEIRDKILSLIKKGILRKENIEMRMCRALSEANLDLALEALSKFGRADLTTVKSKTGYLLGILKRLKDPEYSRYERRRY